MFENTNVRLNGLNGFFITLKLGENPCQIRVPPRLYGHLIPNFVAIQKILY